MTLLTVVTDGWTTTAAQFRAALERRWPNAVVVEVEETSDFSLRWEDPDAAVWEGQLSSKGTGFAIDGTIQGAARLASWFRELVPINHEVLFVDVGNNAEVVVPPGITPEALAEAYVAAANREER